MMVESSKNRYLRRDRYMASKKSHLGYYDGNTAISIEAIPEIEYPEKKKVKKVKSRKALLLRANKKNKIVTVAVIVVAVIFFIFCFQLLALRNLSTTKASKIMELQTTLQELRTVNDELEDDINTNINYKSIYNKAINDYGMQYPSEGQIINYTLEDAGYVKQYQNIP